MEYLKQLGVHFEHNYEGGCGLSATYFVFFYGPEKCAVTCTRPRCNNNYVARKQRELRDQNTKSLEAVMDKANKVLREEELRFQETPQYKYCPDKEQRARLLRDHREMVLSQRMSEEFDFLRYTDVPGFALDAFLNPKACCWRCRNIHAFKEDERWSEKYDPLSFSWERQGRYNCGCAEPLGAFAIACWRRGGG